MENNADPDLKNGEELSGDSCEEGVGQVRLGGEVVDINERQDIFMSHCDELEKKLMEHPVHSEEEAYMLYCEYAQGMGFSVRRSKQYYFEGTKMLRSKTYCCRKQGGNDEQVSRFGKNVPKQETRTGCQAMISFACSRQGEWKVSKFVKEHNHKLDAPYSKSWFKSGQSILAANVYGAGDTSESPSEGDKIRELSIQLADARGQAEAFQRQALIYKRQLDAIFDHIQEHNESLSRKIQKVLSNVMELENTKDDIRNRLHVNPTVMLD